MQIVNLIVVVATNVCWALIYRSAIKSQEKSDECKVRAYKKWRETATEEDLAFFDRVYREYDALLLKEYLNDRKKKAKNADNGTD